MNIKLPPNSNYFDPIVIEKVNALVFDSYSIYDGYKGLSWATEKDRFYFDVYADLIAYHFGYLPIGGDFFWNLTMFSRVDHINIW